MKEIDRENRSSAAAAWRAKNQRISVSSEKLSAWRHRWRISGMAQSSNENNNVSGGNGGGESVAAAALIIINKANGSGNSWRRENRQQRRLS